MHMHEDLHVTGRCVGDVAAVDAIFQPTGQNNPPGVSAEPQRC